MAAPVTNRELGYPYIGVFGGKPEMELKRETDGSDNGKIEIALPK